MLRSVLYLRQMVRRRGMLVRTQCQGCRVSGLYIGATNVRRNFPRDTAAVEFELGHLRIGCQLKPGFWQGQPQICDPRLCEWLEFKLYRERSRHTPLPLTMVKSSRGPFKLLPFPLPSISSNGPNLRKMKKTAVRHHDPRAIAHAARARHAILLPARRRPSGVTHISEAVQI